MLFVRFIGTQHKLTRSVNFEFTINKARVNILYASIL